MADDLIYCPSCRYKLQLPPELYGQSVKAQPPAVWDAQMQQQLDQNPQLTAEERAKFLELLTQENVAYYTMLCGAIGLALNLLTVLGAVMMMRLRGYGLAMLGSILALNPLNAPCCLLEMPFGLWALI